VAVYALLNNGDVAAVSHQGARHSLGRRPDWPWEQSFTLLAVPSPSGAASTLLLGHTTGLLRFDGSFRFPAP
jgi:hypothetical protein